MMKRSQIPLSNQMYENNTHADELVQMIRKTKNRVTFWWPVAITHRYKIAELTFSLTYRDCYAIM